MTPPLLVVNADDFGLTVGTSEAIIRAHVHGIVTSTSVLVPAPGFEASAPLLRSHPGLGVGVHLALVGEDRPVLSGSEITTLVDRRGRLASSWRVLLPRLAADRVDPDDIRRELRAQVGAALALGLELDHLDAHQHLHLWPSVGRVVCELAVELGIGSVRIPTSASAGPKGAVIRRLGATLRSTIKQAGLLGADAAAGLDEAGRWDSKRLAGAVEGLGHSATMGVAGRCFVAEIGCHPGPAVDAERGRYCWRYGWAQELGALCEPGIRRTIADAGFVLGPWSAGRAGATSP